MTMDRLLAAAIAAIGVIGIILSVLLRRINHQELEIRGIQNSLDRLNSEVVKEKRPDDWY